MKYSPDINLCGYIRDMASIDRQYREMVEHSHDIIFKMNMDFIITYINNAVEKILGYKKSDLSNKNGLEIIHPDDISKVEEKFANLLQQDQVHAKFRIQKKNQQYVNLSVNIVLLKDEHGRPKEILGISRDITEQVQVENQLRKIASIVENIQVGMLVCKYSDIELSGCLKLMYVNPAFRKICNRDLDSLIGDCLKRLLSECDNNDLTDKLINICISGTSAEWYDIELSLDKNSKKYFNIKIFPLPDGYVGISFEDVSRIHGYKEKLKEEKIKADIANQAKSAFLANMSHEIRTPLNGIIGFTELISDLKQDASVNEIKEYINIIQKSGKHLLELINNVLDISKIEAGKITLELKEIDMNSLLHTIHYTMASQANKKGIIFKRSIDENIGKIKADQTRIRQVLYNLLSNAVKFTDSGKEVGISAYGQKDKIIIIVWDQGIGIPEDKLETIFKPFEQVNSNKKSAGTGLGLTITKQIMELHGGTIKVRSKIGQGTEFIITLPGRNPDIISEPPPPRLPEFSQKGAKIENKNSGFRILVVEDDYVSSQLYENIFYRERLKFDMVYKGIDAVDIFKKNHYDLVLLDIGLPDISGIEVIKRIRQLKPNIPVIAQSGYSMNHQIKECMSHGFDHFLPKPVDMREIISLIRRYSTI